MKGHKTYLKAKLCGNLYVIKLKVLQTAKTNTAAEDSMLEGQVTKRLGRNLRIRVML